MTKCPCSKNVCRPSTSFFYKVLSSLKQLQGHKKHCNGAGPEDITKFIDKTYNLTGDLLSQVENALRTAESCRFVVKKKNLYSLVSPAATLQFTPSPCIKAKLERIQEIFNSKWCEDSHTKRRSSRRPRRNSHSPLHFITPSQAGEQNNIKKTCSKCTTKKSESKSALKKSTEKKNPNESSADNTALTPLTSSLAKYLKSSFNSCICNSKGKVNRASSALSSKENLCAASSSKISSKKPTPSNSCHVSFKRTRSASSTSRSSRKKRRHSSSHRRGKRHGSRKSSRKMKRQSSICNSSVNENMIRRNSSLGMLDQNSPISCDESDTESSES